MLEATPQAKGEILRGNKIAPRESNVEILAALRIDKRTSAIAQKLAELPEATPGATAFLGSAKKEPSSNSRTAPWQPKKRQPPRWARWLLNACDFLALLVPLRNRLNCPGPNSGTFPVFWPVLLLAALPPGAGPPPWPRIQQRLQPPQRWGQQTGAYGLGLRYRCDGWDGGIWL